MDFKLKDRVVHREAAHGIITGMSSDREYAQVQFDGVLRPYSRTVRQANLTHEEVDDE